MHLMLAVACVLICAVPAVGGPRLWRPAEPTDSREWPVIAQEIGLPEQDRLQSGARQGADDPR